MSSLLLIISLLLHVLAFYIIYSLHIQLQDLKNNDTTEIKEVFERYLREIKNENERLQTELNMNSMGRTKVSNREVTNEKLESANEMSSAIHDSLSDHDFTPDIDMVHDSMETSLEAQILQLYQKGVSITDIAKQLNCGKTEAELIIQFHEKNMMPKLEK